MPEIKCPNCGEVFQIDESNYESIAKQIRDHEFNEELKQREKIFLKDKEDSLNLLRAKNESELNNALSLKEKEINDLKNELKNINISNELHNKEAIDNIKEQLLNKNKEISELNSKLDRVVLNNKVEMNEALSKKEEEIKELKNKNILLKENYDNQLKGKDDIISYYKEMKAKLSTKMIGESLEQHCLFEFEKIRPLFKNAYFEKDNDISNGSKGDFIFKDFDDDGSEIISIMFEMKNEDENTNSKHKNEDFFLKLDKDRKEKKCEYAVLVSLLEMDNELYNQGIVDISHKYEKMYVIRPQNFVPMITLLRNAALKSMDYKKQLITVQNQNLDFTHFEENVNEFKNAFGKNYELASRKFLEAIEDIDKTIKALEKTREALVSSNRQLGYANDKAQDLTIKKLTKNAPSVKELIEGKK